MKIFNLFNKKKESEKETLAKRQLLEEKVVRGAEKAVTEYRRVFERLAEYDRV
ncbi:MAG: hypothetical protein AAB589_03015 [Patescibacteria group bacterium]